MLNCVIVDDEPMATEGLSSYVREISFLNLAGICENPVELSALLSKQAIDLVFLDIQMPELGGFEVLAAFEREATPYIIFVTAYDQYAVRAFEVHAFDYLLKPFDRERFDVAWHRVKEQIKVDQSGERESHILALLEELKSGPRHLERLVIKNGGRVFFLNVQDVYCIESEGNYVRVYDNQKGYLLRETISNLEEQLDPKQFRRIHRSAIVKIDRIKEMQPWFHGEYRIIMENGKELTLSRNYRQNFQGAVGNNI